MIINLFESSFPQDNCDMYMQQLRHVHAATATDTIPSVEDRTERSFSLFFKAQNQIERQIDDGVLSLILLRQ